MSGWVRWDENVERDRWKVVACLEMNLLKSRFYLFWELFYQKLQSLTLDYTFYFFTDFPLRIFYIKILQIEAFLIEIDDTILQLYSEHAIVQNYNILKCQQKNPNLKLTKYTKWYKSVHKKFPIIHLFIFISDRFARCLYFIKYVWLCCYLFMLFYVSSMLAISFFACHT